MLYLAASILAAVFVVAAWGKARSPVETADTMRAFGAPSPSAAARLLPVIEVVVAALLAIWPVVGGLAALLLLAVFTLLLIDDLRRGRGTPCRCFGSASSAPISARTIVRNVGLITLAVLATFANRPF